MTDAEPPRDVGPVQRFFGQALMVVGALIFGFSGLCTGGYLILGTISAVGQRDWSEIADFLPAAAIVGGVPFALGVGLFFLGRFLAPKRRPPVS